MTLAAVTDAERTEVYRQFRGLFDAHKYQEALPLAQQLVTLTEQQYSATDRALVNPLCNLATTAYRLKDYPTAELNYMRSVGILGIRRRPAPTGRSCGLCKGSARLTSRYSSTRMPSCRCSRRWISAATSMACSTSSSSPISSR